MKGYPVWGWGGPDDAPTAADLDALAPFIEQSTGIPAQAVHATAQPPRVDPSRRLASLPPALRERATDDPVARARCGVGRSYRDLVRAMRGDLEHVPDLVIVPRSEQDVVDVLEWASDQSAPVIPFGGGTSVVGGVEPVGLDAAVALDLRGLSGLIEVDATSRAVRLLAGTLGPDAEAALKPHGLTLRFYPQSFERSTVGGWVATRAAGHFSAGPTHIDDLVESIRAVTPTGIWDSRRLPGSGAGPSPDRMLLGSEGSLGVITETWLRAQPRPAHRWSATLAAPDWSTGSDAVRRILQSGLAPATCRLIDAGEASITGTLTTGEAALVVGLESLRSDLGPVADEVLAMAQDAGLRVVESGQRADAGGSWRSSFVRAPYLREQLILLGVLVETFETAVTWDRLDGLVAQVTVAVTDALVRVCGGGRVTCRLTHVYPDGAAPYFTVLAPARRGSEVAQWDEIKVAASEAILAAGGTITHHHAVGRDHGGHYRRQRPAPFGRALGATKRELDPAGVLNPGVLV